MSVTKARWEKLRPGDVLEHVSHGSRFVVGLVSHRQFRGKPQVERVVATKTIQIEDHKQWRVVPKDKR